MILRSHGRSKRLHSGPPSGRGSFLLALFLLGAAACAKEKPPETAAPRQASIIAPVKYRERNNLAALANGGVIVSRTAEEALDLSPIFMIDSFADTAWVTPAGDPAQSAVIALAAPSRIREIGMTTRGPRAPAASVRKIQVELSDDGVAYRAPLLLTSKLPTDSIKVSLPQPSTASFIRVTLGESSAPRRTAELASLEVNGDAIEAREPAELNGTWSTPGGRIVLSAAGGRLSGRAEMVESDPLFLEGWTGDGTGAFSWTRGREVGFGFLAVHGDFLNAVLWHEKPISLFVSTSWIAKRSGAGSVASRNERDAIRQFLAVTGRYPSYSLRFDQNHAPQETAPGHLDTLLSVIRANGKHPFTLAVMHASQFDEKANEQATQKRAETLRALILSKGEMPENLSIVARGSHYDHDVPSNELDRLLYDRVDLELGSFSATRSIQNIQLR